MMSVTKWETMTVKEMAIHLFLEQSDATMLKAAMKVLAALRTKVAEIMLQNNWGPVRSATSAAIVKSGVTWQGRGKQHLPLP